MSKVLELKRMGYEFVKVRRQTHIHWNKETETCLQLNLRTKKVMKVVGKWNSREMPLTETEQRFCSEYMEALLKIKEQEGQ